MSTIFEDLLALEALEHGDPCEWRQMGTRVWQAGTIVWNGGESYWAVEDLDGAVHHVKMEQVRVPNTNPWRRWAFG